MKKNEKTMMTLLWIIAILAIANFLGFSIPSFTHFLTHYWDTHYWDAHFFN